jgi:hypothetical protein
MNILAFTFRDDIIEKTIHELQWLEKVQRTVVYACTGTGVTKQR